MYRRKHIHPLVWTSGVLVLVVIIVVLIGRLDFPGWILRGMSSMVPSKPDAPHTEAQYQELNEKLGTLQQENTYLNELVLDYQRQDSLSVVSLEIKVPTLNARVIYRDHTRLFDTAIIDRGLFDGVRPEMPVVDSRGLVGRVIEATSATSRIVLISSPDCSYGVIDQRSRDLGIVRGTRPVAWNALSTKTPDATPPDMLEFQYLSPSAQINVQDLLITSGLSGITPRGIRVGEVVEIIKREDEGKFDIRVRPFADLNHLENVAVVLFTEEDLATLEEPGDQSEIQLSPPPKPPSGPIPPDTSEGGSDVAPSTPSTANEG